jgi:hypothetical protein
MLHALPADVIFSIPEQLLLYGARAYQDAEYGPAFRRLQAEAGPALDQRSLLVLLLVLERCRGSDSFFAPYVLILPTEYGEHIMLSATDAIEQMIVTLQDTR